MYRLLILERGIGDILFNIRLLIFKNYPQQPEDGFIIEQQSGSSLYSCSHSVKTSVEFSWHNLVFLFYYCNIDHYALSLNFFFKIEKQPVLEIQWIISTL